jgi:hypothetical protein
MAILMRKTIREATLSQGEERANGEWRLGQVFGLLEGWIDGCAAEGVKSCLAGGGRIQADRGSVE